MEPAQDKTTDRRRTPSPFIPTGVPSLSTATANAEMNSMAEPPLNSGTSMDQTTITTAAQPTAAASVTNKPLPSTTNITSSTLPPPASSGTTTPAAAITSQIQSPASQSATNEKHMGTLTTAQEEDNTIRNQKYVEEFQYLLEKSQSLFSGLRDLPPTGSHRQWRPYFEKTFEVYTKLWKFQQAHRSLLEEKNNYGLKRWEVGEIASKIGQLYYHYYLRTSETNYLHEAYVFYEAIHDRQYFKNILEVKNPALMIKKMRYYARFVVVGLLLNKDENIRLLISELELLIDEYTKMFKPVDAKEWQMVLQEITTFMEAEKKLVPINADRNQVPIKHRLPSQQLEKPQGLRLQEAILVGNYQNQIKFSELTLDMYRMLQSLEREPIAPTTTKSTPKDLQQPRDQTSTQPGDKKETNGPSNANSPTTNTYSLQQDKAQSSSNSKRMNPHKYLLFRPTFTQLLVYIATAFKDTGDNAVMLLYLSADGCVNESSRGYGFSGGVSTSQRKTNTNTANIGSSNLSNTGNNPTAAPGTPNLPGTTTASNTGTGSTVSGVIDSTQPSGIPLSGPNVTNMNATTGTATTTGGNPTSTLSGSKLTNTNTATIANTGHSNVSGSAGTGGTSNGANTTPPTTQSAATTTIPTSSSTTPTTTASAATLAPPSIQACLYPADLIPFTRKPLFLIIDSNNSSAFHQSMPNLFDQPLMCLLSPVVYPSSIQDKSEIGSLFTLFLHTPLLGFCSVSDIGNLDQEKWDESIEKVNQLERSIGKLLLEEPDLDISIKRFMADDFLWTFIVRFVLCGIILRCHSSFKSEKSYPTSYPNIPEAIYTAPYIMTLFNELTLIAEVSTYFNIPLPVANQPTPTTATTTGTSTTLPSLTTTSQQTPTEQQANPPPSPSINNATPMDTS